MNVSSMQEPLVSFARRQRSTMCPAYRASPHGARVRTCLAHTVRIALVATTVLLGACASTPGGGVRIGDETLKQFEAGVTTEAWVLAILGEPTDISWVDGVENTKVLRYSLTAARTGLMSLFTGSDVRTVSVVYFIVTNGVVTRFWADREIERTPFGKPVEATVGETLEE